MITEAIHDGKKSGRRYISATESWWKHLCNLSWFNEVSRLIFSSTTYCVSRTYKRKTSINLVQCTNDPYVIDSIQYINMPFWEDRAWFIPMLLHRIIQQRSFNERCNQSRHHRIRELSTSQHLRRIHQNYTPSSSAACATALINPSSESITSPHYISIRTYIR